MTAYDGHIYMFCMTTDYHKQQQSSCSKLGAINNFAFNFLSVNDMNKNKQQNDLR